MTRFEELQAKARQQAFALQETLDQMAEIAINEMDLDTEYDCGDRYYKRAARLSDLKEIMHEVTATILDAHLVTEERWTHHMTRFRRLGTNSLSRRYMSRKAPQEAKQLTPETAIHLQEMLRQVAIEINLAGEELHDGISTWRMAILASIVNKVRWALPYVGDTSKDKYSRWGFRLQEFDNSVSGLWRNLYRNGEKFDFEFGCYEYDEED